MLTPPPIVIAALAGCSTTIDAGDIVSGTIEPARLPGEVVTEDELPDPGTPGEPTTDAGDLTSGTLAVERLPAEVVLDGELPAPPEHGVAGVSITDFVDQVELEGTAFVELMAVEVPVTGPVDVAFDGHMYVEKPVSTGRRYEFVIAEGDCDGTVVGRTFWRPNQSETATNNHADSLALGGFAEDVTGTTTFVACGAKFDTLSEDASVLLRSMTARW